VYLVAARDDWVQKGRDDEKWFDGFFIVLREE